MRTSIRQVAERAGVSAMTVTNVLHQRASQVSPQTRQRVLHAVEELNYIPIRSVMQNRHVATHAIGVLFLQDMRGAVGYPTFLGICDRAKAIDHDLTILLRSEPHWAKKGADVQFLDRRCDGFIFVGDEQPELSRMLVRHEIPLVECYSVAPPGGVARVLGNNAEAMQIAVERLVREGHTKIAHLAGPESSGEARERRDAFRAAMHSVGLSGAVVVQGASWGDLWGFDEGNDPGLVTRPLAQEILSRDVSAVVCANDLLALALWKMAEQKGLRVPDDLSIIGMDNIREAAHKGLTSIAIPFGDIGAAAVDALHAMLRGESAETVSRLLPATLIERRSVAPPRHRL